MTQSSALVKQGRKDSEGQWTWETKLDVVDKLLHLGNMRAVAELTNVPYDTIKQWKQADWFPRIVEEIKQEKRAGEISRLGSLASKALSIVEDRMENGDFFLNPKTGKVGRKPVAFRDAAKVATDLTQTRVKVENQNSGPIDNGATIQETLKVLANEFAKFANRSKQNAIDVEFKEVL